MAFQKSANAHHPQIVTLVVDDSGSMEGSKAKQATEGMQDLIITLQSLDLKTSRFKFLLNIAKFGDSVVPLATRERPKDVNLQNLMFEGKSGQTNIAAALDWAKQALDASLQYCRGLPDYAEEESPNPLCILFTDGENTGIDVGQSASALKAVQVRDGQTEVVVCGIGLQAKDFATVQAIASDPSLATNIGTDQVGKFIAAVTDTVVKGEGGKELIDKARGMQQALGQSGSH